MKESVLSATFRTELHHTVKSFLQDGVDVNTEGGKYGYSLIATAYSGFADVIDLLIVNVARCSVKSREFGCAYQAAKGGWQIKVMRIDGKDCGPTDDEGMALHREADLVTRTLSVKCTGHED